MFALTNIVRLTEPGAHFDRLMVLYHSAFDRECRDPDEDLLRDLDDGPDAYRLDVALEGDQMLGFVRWRHLPRTRATFVVHLAVDSALRGAGTGTALFETPRNTFPDIPLLLEVEHVSPDASAERRHECERRLEWFAHRGAHAVSPTYTQPALHTDSEPVSLNLLAVGEVEDRVGTVINFYREAWNLPSDHPFVIRAVAGAQATDQVPW